MPVLSAMMGFSPDIRMMLTGDGRLPAPSAPRTGSALSFFSIDRLTFDQVGT